MPVISMLPGAYSQQGVNLSLLTPFTPVHVSVTGALIVLITGLKEKPLCICGILDEVHRNCTATPQTDYFAPVLEEETPKESDV